MSKSKFMCRHCLLLSNNTCPYPVVRSVHRMSIPAGNCPLAKLNPLFAYIYPEMPSGTGEQAAATDAKQRSTGGERRSNNAV